MEVSEAKLYLTLSDGTHKVVNLQECKINARAIGSNPETTNEDGIPIESVTWQIFIDGCFTSNSVVSASNHQQVLMVLKPKK